MTTTATTRSWSVPDSRQFVATAGSTFPSLPRFAIEAVSLGDAFSFLVPLLQFLRFDLVGEVSVSDLIILAVLPIALLRHSERLRQKPVPTILTLGFLWLVAQIVTDLLRNTAPFDYLRGWSKIYFLLANFTVVWIVACCSRRRFALYGAGAAIGTILAFYAHPSSDALVAPWKFALGAPVTFLVVLVLSLSLRAGRSRYLTLLVPLSALAVVHAFEDVRSLAVITFISSVFSVFHMHMHMSMAGGQPRFGRSRLLFLAVTIAFAVWGFTGIYSYYAEQGLFGEYAERKLAAQTSGAGGLLLGGRGEILASSQAILDSPLLGHGSWARDPIYSAILTARRAELGYKELDHSSGPRDDLIPTHSYIFGAWVEAGVAGAVFWVFILGFTLRTLLKVSGSEPLLPLFAFGGLLQIWDLLFSPLGNPTHFIAPYFIAATVALSTLRGSPSTSRPTSRPDFR